MSMNVFYRTVVLFVVLMVGLGVNGQQVNVSGKLFSVSTREIISGVSIRLFTTDSSLRQMVLSDSTGRFQFTNIKPGDYTIAADAVSFELFKKSIHISKSKDEIQLDSLFLQPSFESLKGIVISAKRPAVAVKSDTTEFSASTFRVRKNGTVEDVFKKMPGLEVDKNGSVKAQGETVTQIYVDGKPFFGTYLKSVTQTFPADIIDKIQIIDKKSEQALATKVEDGVHEKIINITLKKDRKRGLFGKDYIGYGTADRFEAKLNTNMFNNDRKVSIIAGANNTGRNDNNNAGSDDASYNNWNGINDNQQLKINYANKFGKDFDLNTYAGFERNGVAKVQSKNRQNIFGDSTSFYAENNKSKSADINYNAGLYFEYRLDTLTNIKFNEWANVGKNTLNLLSNFNSTRPNTQKINEGTRANINSGTSPSLNGQINFNHRFPNSRRNIYLGFSNSINANEGGNYNISNNHFYPVNIPDYILAINQLNDTHNRSSQIGTAISYNEPLSERSTLNVNYNFNYGKNNLLKQAFDFDSSFLQYNRLNDTLSNHFDNNNYTTAISMNYNYGSPTIGFGTGIRWQESINKNRSFDRDTLFQQSFKGFNPNLNFYHKSKYTWFNIYYNFSVQAPQPGQLQPVPDNSNPLYVRLGNPSLKYALVHGVRYHFNYYNPKKESGINTSAGFSTIEHNIASSNLFDNSIGKQIYQPVNIEGADNWSAWISYFRPLHLGKEKLKWNVNISSSGSKNTNLLNGSFNVSHYNNESFYVGVTYDAPKWIDIHTNFSLSRQATDYSMQSALNTVSYFMNVSPNITLTPSESTEINIDYNYRQTTGQSAGYNTSVNMLNADIVQYLTTKKNVWIKLKGYDLLNQNVSIWRSTGDNFIQDTRANVLSRFLLLSLNFRFNKFNSKPENMDFPSTPQGVM